MLTTIMPWDKDDDILEKAALKAEQLKRLRDEFAMAAMTGCLAYSHVNPMSGNFQENGNIQKDCEHFYKYADEMLKARDKS